MVCTVTIEVVDLTGKVSLLVNEHEEDVSFSLTSCLKLEFKRYSETRNKRV